jgi:hypothetical protein
MRRNRDGVNVRFEWVVIALFLRGAACTALRRLDLVLVTYGYPAPNLTVTWLEQFPVPASHTL